MIFSDIKKKEEFQVLRVFPKNRHTLYIIIQFDSEHSNAYNEFIPSSACFWRSTRNFCARVHVREDRNCTKSKYFSSLRLREAIPRESANTLCLPRRQWSDCPARAYDPLPLFSSTSVPPLPPPPATTDTESYCNKLDFSLTRLQTCSRAHTRLGLDRRQIIESLNGVWMENRLCVLCRPERSRARAALTSVVYRPARRT